MLYCWRLAPGQALLATQRAYHDPPALGRRGSKATDISIAAKEILRLKDRLNEILAAHTGKKATTLAKDTERDFFMSADEAKTYGLVDEVLVKRVQEK